MKNKNTDYNDPKLPRVFASGDNEFLKLTEHCRLSGALRRAYVSSDCRRQPAGFTNNGGGWAMTHTCVNTDFSHGEHALSGRPRGVLEGQPSGQPQNG